MFSPSSLQLLQLLFPRQAIGYTVHMFRRLLLLLLIALLPLQGIAASFMVKCAGMAAEQAPCHEMAAPADDTSARDHDHQGQGGSSGTDHCCHSFPVAIPQGFVLPGAGLAPGQHYPALTSSYSDYLPDRLQRPPPSLSV